MLPPTSNLYETRTGRSLCYTMGNTGYTWGPGEGGVVQESQTLHRTFACDHKELTPLFHPDPPGQTREERAKGTQQGHQLVTQHSNTA